MKIKVAIIPPKKWFKYTKYELLESVSMGGVTAPEGFVSDGATIPRWATAVGVILMALSCIFNAWIVFSFGAIVAMVPVIFPKTNKYFAAAVVHDYYIVSGLGPRWKADFIFKGALKELGVHPMRYWPMFLVVFCYTILSGGKTGEKNAQRITDPSD